jgi:hypothetical protein
VIVSSISKVLPSKGIFSWPTAFHILMFFSVVILNSCSSNKLKKFDSNAWKEQSELRYLMANDIIGRKLLNGMSKDKVIKLLGSDIEKGPCTNCIGYSTNKPDQGFSIDHEVLEISFDKYDKVTFVRLNSW